VDASHAKFEGVANVAALVVTPMPDTVFRPWLAVQAIHAHVAGSRGFEGAEALIGVQILQASASCEISLQTRYVARGAMLIPNFERSLMPKNHFVFPSPSDPAGVRRKN